MATQLIPTTTTIIIITTLLTTIFHPTSSLPPETITNAADTLSNSGYVAMSLTLNLISDVMFSHLNTATIFTPSDSSFADHGQPSLTTLQTHFSPMVFSLYSLRSLPYGTKIPTVDPDTFLTVTTPSPSDQISINNVSVIGSPVFDDGSLVVFGIEKFLDPNFTITEVSDFGSGLDSGLDSGSMGHCTTSFGGHGNVSFHESANVLISRGYSVMASFLNLQLIGGFVKSQPALTVFAPSDEVMVDYSGRFPDYQSLFHRHVLPCKVTWRDLSNVGEDGTSGFGTFLDGFEIKVNRSGGGFNVNEAAVTFPDMYYSDWIVVHGISDVLSLPEDEGSDGEGDPFEDIPVKSSRRGLIGSAPDRSEF